MFYFRARYFRAAYFAAQAIAGSEEPPTSTAVEWILRHRRRGRR